MLEHMRIPNPWGAETVILDTVGSTNDHAKGLIRAGAAHGTVVLAEQQTGGKGRLGRSFSSPAGLGIYCSVILRFGASPEQLFRLTPMTAEAVRRAIVEVTGLTPAIKWINDLVLDGKKLCGILTELVSHGDSAAVVVGIGVNCGQRREDFPPQLQETATSLSMHRPVEREPVIAAMLRQVKEMADHVTHGWESWMEDYRAHCLTLGQDVQLLRAGEIRYAHVDGMDDSGALLVTLADGTKETVFSGEASVRGMYGYV